MKNFAKLIAESVEEVVPEDDAVATGSPEDAKEDEKVKTYLSQGYQLKGVSMDDDGNRLAMLVKGDYDDVAYVVLEGLMESKASQTDIESMLNVLMQAKYTKVIGSDKYKTYLYKKPSFKRIMANLTDEFGKPTSETQDAPGQNTFYTFKITAKNAGGWGLFKGLEITVNNMKPDTWVKVQK